MNDTNLASETPHNETKKRNSQAFDPVAFAEQAQPSSLKKLKPTKRKIAPRNLTRYQDFFASPDKDYAFVDKTMFIKEFKESHYYSEILLRPRRSGRSVNLSMLNCYFSILEAENYEKNFRRTKIYQEKKFYERHGNKYPVIYLNFNSFNTESNGNPDWPLDSFGVILKQALDPYYSLLKSSTNLREFDQRSLESLVKDKFEWPKGIWKLSYLLKKHYNKECIVLIDDYDLPVSRLFGKEEDLQNFKDHYQTFLRSGLKDNSDVDQSLLIGVTKVTLASIFSGFNNAAVNILPTPSYEKYFGFNETEVHDIFCQVKNAEPTKEELEDVQSFYGGYIGESKQEYYNPASVVCYLDEEKLKNYWNDTEQNLMLLSYYENLGEGDLLNLKELMRGKSIQVEIRSSGDLAGGLDFGEKFWSLLFYSGYLTDIKTETKGFSWKELRLSIPNIETQLCLEKLERDFNLIMKSDGSSETLNNVFIMNEMKQFIEIFNSEIKASQNKRLAEGTALSYYDFLYWNLREKLQESWIVDSQMDVGESEESFDILLIPKNAGNIGYILEIRSLYKNDLKKLEEIFEITFKNICEKDFLKNFETKEFQYVKQVQLVALIGCDLQLHCKPGKLVTLIRNNVNN